MTGDFVEDFEGGEGISESTETLTNLALDGDKSGNDTEEATASAPVTKEEENETDISNIRYEDVWQKPSEEVKRGVSELWDEQTKGQMTEEMKRKRMEFVCVVAYDGEKVVAVSTIVRQKNQGLWCTIGYFRCIVHSDYRRKGVATQLAIRCKAVLAEYSKKHPDQRIQAMGMTMPGNILGDRGKQPFWPELGMTLHGYNQANMQLRVAWFDHVRLDY